MNISVRWVRAFLIVIVLACLTACDSSDPTSIGVDAANPVITLLGADPMTVEAGATFTDPGATVADDVDTGLTITVGGTVDTAVLGSYILTYDATDSDDNVALTVTRTVNVVDTTAPVKRVGQVVDTVSPVISLLGANPFIIEGDSPFTDPGVTVTDNVDTGLTASVTGTVNTAILGTYTLVYNVVDLSGNAATSVSRTVTVVDTTAPVISLAASNPMTVEGGSTFSDPGATVVDRVETGLIVSVSGTVNTAVVGTYILTYTAGDSSGNLATPATRTVNVVDIIAPVITLSGTHPMTVEGGSSFTDPGSTITDNMDTGLTATVTGSIDTATVGSYVLTYNVTDTAGNAATTVTRTVNVVDTTAPVITLSGTDPMTVEGGSTFTDPGSTITDNIDTGLIATVTGTVDAATVGSYVLTYNVSDTAGNAATPVTRTVSVEDTTAPVIALLGTDPMTVEGGSTFTDPGSTITDNMDTGLTATVTGTVDTATVGSYVLTYNVIDTAGNAATPVTRTVNVEDTTAPAITLLGTDPMTVEGGSAFTDPGSTITDNIDTGLTATVTGAVDTATVGSYVLTYNVSDTAGNAATPVTRTVNVEDTTAPVIALLGTDPMTVEGGSIFTDPGVTIIDNVDGVLTETVTGTVNTSLVGGYVLTYNVSDPSGNAATPVMRTVNVVDTTAPVIALNGGDPLEVEVDSIFTDPGATVTDNIDSGLIAVVTGTVDTTTLGSYTLTYDINDSSGNAATPVTRTVDVVPIRYSIGGSISGLAGSGLVIQNNAGDDFVVTAGETTFTFATNLNDGDSYDITVLTQPASPIQSCVVTNGSSTISGSDVTIVSITCTTLSWIQVTTGNQHTLALKANGTLWAWGKNDKGQLGDSTTTNRSSPVQVGMDTDWVQVASGPDFSLAIKSDGTLWAWGYNIVSQLGDGTTTTRFSPVKIGTDTNWVQVAAGLSFGLALKSNGTLWAWGANSKGQLGDSTTTGRSSPVQVGTDTDWKQAIAGGYHSLALKNGTTDAANDGTLWAWGDNFNGQLGDATNTQKTSPVQVGTDNDWEQISAGTNHTLAIKNGMMDAANDGTLWGWGDNFAYKLGDGTTTDKNTPVQLSLETDWKRVEAGNSYSMAIKNGTTTVLLDGTLWAWGYNYYSQLGDGTTTTRTTPVQIGSDADWSEVSASHVFTAAIKTDGTMSVWGDNYEGQLGIGASGEEQNRLSPDTVGTDSDWKQVDTGYYHTVAIKNGTTSTGLNGTLWSWGLNTQGQLGDSSTANRNAPVQIGVDADWEKIFVGYHHNLATKTDGTLWAWGHNFYGQIGDGTKVQKESPVQIGTDTDWVSAFVGSNHTLALKVDGTLWGWGRNNFGQLGDGTIIDKITPIQIGSETDWSQAVAGSDHAIATKNGSTDAAKAGTLWAWGRNSLGQLGDETTIDRLTPTQIGTETDWDRLYAGAWHSLAIKNGTSDAANNGSLWAWGYNYYGQLANSAWSVNKVSPTQIGTDTDWIEISAGLTRTLAIRSDGSLWAWGGNRWGELGDGTVTDRFAPVQIGMETNWSIVTTGGTHSLAIKTGSTLHAWGYNYEGQLGIGTSGEEQNRSTPTPLP